MFSRLSRDGNKIRDYWKTHGEIDLENQKKLRKAMLDSGVKESSIPLLLYHQNHQDKHAAIVQLLKL